MTSQLNLSCCCRCGLQARNATQDEAMQHSISYIDLFVVKSLHALSEVIYCCRYGFASTSLLRVSGVHLGCSCAGEESGRSACSRTDADLMYLEKPHSPNGILAVQSEAVIDARRHNNQIVLLNLRFVSAVQPSRNGNGASGRTFMRIHRESSFDLTSK